MWSIATNRENYAREEQQHVCLITSKRVVFVLELVTIGVTTQGEAKSIARLTVDFDKGESANTSALVEESVTQQNMDVDQVI